MYQPSKEELQSLSIDKLNGNVAYNDEKHWYWNTDTLERYCSVTQLIGKYHEDFNERFWSRMKALQEIIGDTKTKKIRNAILAKNGGNFEDPKILDELIIVAKRITTAKDYRNRVKKYLAAWAEENRIANENGSKFHLEKEEKLLRDGYYEDPLRKERFPVVETQDLSKAEKITIVEPLLYSHKYKIAGQSDKVIRDLGTVDVNDYKTNKKLEFESFKNPYSGLKKKMFYPLQHIDDINGKHYQVQLSLYAYFIEETYNLKIGKLTLEYTNNYKDISYYPLMYLREDVVNLLEHYKKTYYESEN